MRLHDASNTVRIETLDLDVSSLQTTATQVSTGDSGRSDGTFVGTPLLLNGWLEFNRMKHDLQPLRIRAGGNHNEDAFLNAAVYLDPRGRIKRPSRNPYVPITFHGTPTHFHHKTERQWHDLASRLVNEMRSRGIVNEIHLPPAITDVRPWQWAGFAVGVRYTFIIDFPHSREFMSKQVRSRIRRCEREGFRAERTNDMSAIFACLQAAEVRQGYTLGITLEDLHLAYELLGDEHFLAYVAYAPNGDVASSAIVLHSEGARAIGWIGGTVTEYLPRGVADLVEAVSYDDLEESGATGLDLCGANMQSIAAYKASLGARLVPYYSIEAYDSRRLGKWMQSWWHFLRGKSES